MLGLVVTMFLSNRMCYWPHIFGAFRVPEIVTAWRFRILHDFRQIKQMCLYCRTNQRGYKVDLTQWYRCMGLIMTILHIILVPILDPLSEYI
jgi:hypothetical protein